MTGFQRFAWWRLTGLDTRAAARSEAAEAAKAASSSSAAPLTCAAAGGERRGRPGSRAGRRATARSCAASTAKPQRQLAIYPAVISAATSCAAEPAASLGRDVDRDYVQHVNPDDIARQPDAVKATATPCGTQQAEQEGHSLSPSQDAYTVAQLARVGRGSEQGTAANAVSTAGTMAVPKAAPPAGATDAGSGAGGARCEGPTLPPAGREAPGRELEPESGASWQTVPTRAPAAPQAAAAVAKVSNEDDHRTLAASGGALAVEPWTMVRA